MTAVLRTVHSELIQRRSTHACTHAVMDGRGHENCCGKVYAGSLAGMSL